MDEDKVRANLSPTAEEALREFLRCCAEGFTGTLSYEFTEGSPAMHRRTDTVRYGAPGKREEGG